MVHCGASVKIKEFKGFIPGMNEMLDVEWKRFKGKTEEKNGKKLKENSPSKKE